MARGLTPALAEQVAVQLMAKDALGAHARDELGLYEATAARPLQAALTSAVTFAAGALLPVVIVAVAPRGLASAAVTASTLVLLAVLGALAARIGGAALWSGAGRVAFWGALAMAASAAAGRLFGVVV